MIIDMHTHTWTTIQGRIGETSMVSSKYGKVLVKKGEETYERRWLPPAFVDTSFPAEVLLEYMDWCGVDKAVLLQAQIYNWPDDNQYIADVSRKYPDRFIGFGQLDLTSGKQSLERLDEIVNIGLKGLKLELPGMRAFHPSLKLDEPALFPFWERVSDYGLALTIYPGIDKHPPEAQETCNLIEKFNLRVVLTHLGLSFPGKDARTSSAKLEYLRMAKTYDDVYTDIGGNPLLWSSHAETPKIPIGKLPPTHRVAIPHPDWLEYFKFICQEIGTDKILWGSDIPCAFRDSTYYQQISVITDECDFLTEKQKKDILGNNAERMFKRWGIL